jgi:hypothetical protein
MKKLLIILLCVLLVACSFGLIACQKEEPTTYTVTFMRKKIYYRGVYINETTVEITEDCIIGNNAPETIDKSSIVFYGWYTEEGCSNQWDIYSDKVNCDITLYALYKKEI